MYQFSLSPMFSGGWNNNPNPNQNPQNQKNLGIKEEMANMQYPPNSSSLMFRNNQYLMNNNNSIANSPNIFQLWGNKNRGHIHSTNQESPERRHDQKNVVGNPGGQQQILPPINNASISPTTGFYDLPPFMSHGNQLMGGGTQKKYP